MSSQVTPASCSKFKIQMKPSKEEDTDHTLGVALGFVLYEQ